MSNPIKKYLVIGGYIYSKNDRRRHYIPGSRLVDLYGVSRNECIITDSENIDRDLLRSGISPTERSRLIRLFPQYDGNYEITHASRS